MLTVHSARQIVLDQCHQVVPGSLSVETIPLLESYGRVIAVALYLDRDQPPFPRSMRDGFAVRAGDLQSVPATLKCVGEVRAGQVPHQTVGQGEAVQIMTGAPLPEGADAVVMVEHTERGDEDEVRVQKQVKAGGNVVPKGSEHRAGATVLAPGDCISAFGLAALASVGKSQVSVYRQPSVSILATGDEIVEITQTPGPAQIRNSNSFSLYGQVRRNGGVPRILKTAGDNVEDLHRQIRLGLESEILLVSGGVSMGKYDLVEPVFRDLGIDVHFESVSMRPGKPTVFATWKDRWIFGLPGNPISTFVAFELFVRPVLRVLQGLSPDTLPLVRGVLQTSIAEKSGRTAFLPARAVFQKGKLEVDPLTWKSSADVFGAVEANALIVVPMDVASINAGDEVDALLFEELHYATESRF